MKIETKAISSNAYFINSIQTYCISGRTICLTAQFESGAGEFYLENGELTFAVLGDLVAEEALYLALKESCGTLRVVENPPASPPRNINVGWRKLLVEGLARLNHENSNAAELDSAPIETNQQPTETFSSGNTNIEKQIDKKPVLRKIESREQNGSESKLDVLPTAKTDFSLPSQKFEQSASNQKSQTNGNIIAFDSYRLAAHKEPSQNSQIAEVSLPSFADIIAALTQISESAAQYLGRTVVANYWRKAQKDEWNKLIEITMNGKFEAKEPLKFVTVELWESACEWANAFIKRCSVIVRDFPTEAQNLTGKALILTKPGNNYFEQSKDDLKENLNEASAYRTARH